MDVNYVKLLGVTIIEGYPFGKHAKMVAGNIKSKFKKLSSVADTMDFVDWRRTVQKAMNITLRLLTGRTRYLHMDQI